jgi:hypothetical protein
MVGPTIGVIASVPSIVSARIFVAISGIAVAVAISGIAVAAAATPSTTAPAPSRFRRSWKCHCGRGDGDHSRSSENKFSEFRMHYVSSVSRFLRRNGDRSQSDHGPKFARVSARGRPVLLPWREDILRAAGIKSRGPFLSPRWTLVQTKGRRLLLYSAHGMNQSIIPTSARIAAVVSKSPRNALSLVIGRSPRVLRLDRRERACAKTLGTSPTRTARASAPVDA